MSWRKKKVKANKWYVVDLRILHEPLLFRNEFNNKKSAIEAICNHLSFNFKDYIPISGEDAITYNIQLKKLMKKGGYRIPVVKYDYPPERITYQNKKTYRTIIRRKLRKLKNESK